MVQVAAGARDWLHVVPSMLKLVGCAPLTDGRKSERSSGAFPLLLIAMLP